MSLRKTALIPMMLASMACVQSASAQTTGPTEEAPGSPCQVDARRTTGQRFADRHARQMQRRAEAACSGRSGHG